MSDTKSTDKRVVLSWSGGKDSALALQALRANGYEVISLLTTVASDYDRISHHGVRASLLEEQARAADIPLHRVDLPTNKDHACTNEQYEKVMREALERYLDIGVRTVAFGDIYLKDLRAYRESRLAQVGMMGLFPLWGQSTEALVRRFIDGGFKAYLSCVSLESLDRSFAGRSLDAAFVEDLPDGLDVCGEKGEYHSFVYDGPVFKQPLRIRVGERVVRDVRCFADLLFDQEAAQTSAQADNAARRPLDDWAEARLVRTRSSAS